MWVRRKLSGLVLVVLTVGAAAPAALWALWDVQDTRLRLYQAFDQDIRQFQGKLASGLQAPLWDLNPELATPLLDAQFQDTRLVSLSVLTDTRQLFYHRDELRRRDGHVRPGIFRCCGKVASWGVPWRSFVMAVQAQIARERDERLWLIGTQFGADPVADCGHAALAAGIAGASVGGTGACPGRAPAIAPFCGGVRMSWGGG